MANYPYNYNPYIQEYQAMRDRIDSNIRQMQQQQMQQQNQMIPQQPITQNFQIAPVQQQQNDLQAKYVNSIDEVKNIFVMREGLFVNKEMNTLWVKNINGDIKTYSLQEVIEIDPKDVEITNLKNEISNMRNLLSQQAATYEENNEPEMCFNTIEKAERFVEVMSELSILYMNDKRRFSMQFLADIMKRMSNAGIITINDLYELSEKEIIDMIKECKDFNISECFNIWQNGLDVKTNNEKVLNKYSINVKAKKRYINPLVKTKNGVERIMDISDKAKECINSCLEYTFDRYIYMDFNFNDNEKILKK